MSERKILKVIKKQKVIGPKDTMWYNLMSYYSYPNPAPHCNHTTDRFYGVYPSAKEKWCYPLIIYQTCVIYLN